MSLSVTPQANNLLRFIEGYMAANDGIAPSHDEMREGLGLRSKSGVNRLLGQLEDRGIIVRLPYRNRCMQVMEPTARTVVLPADLYLDAHAAANRAGTTVNALVANAVRCWLDTE